MSIQPDPLRARGSDVAALGDVLRRGGAALENVPEQIKQLLKSGDWRHFVTKLGHEVHHERFAEFVTTSPLAGLGTSVPTIRKLMVDDVEALDLLDRESEGRQGERTDLVHNVHEVERPAGNSRDRALRKLRTDAPELHAEVLAGRLSAHKAMVEAGFRPPTFTVRADSPESVAATLRRQLDPAVLAQVAQLINGEG